MHRYRDHFYARYASDQYSHVNRHDRAFYDGLSGILFRAYGRFLPQNKNAVILDAGCGYGIFLYALRAAGYTNAEGVDISSEQVEAGTSYGLKVTLGNALDFVREKEEHYDLIISKDLLEHLSKDELVEYTSLVAKALKPGGSFICAVPNANSPFAARFRYRDLTHEIAFTQESLRQLLLSAGLTPEYLGGEVLKPFTPNGWIRYAMSRLYRAWWKGFMMAELGQEASGVPLDFNLIGVARK